MAGFYAFVKEQESIAFPEKPFDPGGRPATEKEEGVRYKQMHEEYYNKYRSDSIWYGFSEESCNETIQEEISQTKDKLKM